MLNLFKSKIDQLLSELVPLNSSFSPSLYEGGRYSLLASGKRIRPLLTLCIAEMINEGAHEIALFPACAVEMVHTYSLIHDDLPCIDDDDFRRGLPTLHKVYNEGHAVLVGDFLLTYAFEVITKSPGIGAEQKILLTHTLATAAGGEGMISGQIMDIECSNHIEEMHARKTAALFCAAVKFGGIVAQCNSDVMSYLESFGKQFGKLFQIIDDILDADHPLGLEKAEESALAYRQSSLEILERLPFNCDILKQLTDSIFNQKFSYFEKN